MGHPYLPMVGIAVPNLPSLLNFSRLLRGSAIGSTPAFGAYAWVTKQRTYMETKQVTCSSVLVRDHELRCDRSSLGQVERSRRDETLRQGNTSRERRSGAKTRLLRTEYG